jgi:[lysine-biosynthesis-protein LysW]--L-2-aminoadipate ligase
MTRIGLLHTGIRGDEKLLIEASKQMGIDLELIDLRAKILDPRNLENWQSYDCFLERSISTEKGNSAIEFLDNSGFKVFNNKEVMSICTDKFQTATVLDRFDVPNLRSVLVHNEVSAKEAVERFGGYPVVVKSREGSWGRLIAKVNDEESLEGLVDHRSYMGVQHQSILIQEYAEKPGRDIRTFVIGGETICAIYRSSEHWITNTARGGKATNCPVTPEISEICRKASEAVGGGILAMDLFETEEGLKVNEINHTMEFKNSEEPTGVSISTKILEYCIG